VSAAPGERLSAVSNSRAPAATKIDLVDGKVVGLF
jgi:hypothetical protein